MQQGNNNIVRSSNLSQAHLYLSDNFFSLLIVVARGETRRQDYSSVQIKKKKKDPMFLLIWACSDHVNKEVREEMPHIFYTRNGLVHF